MSLPGEAVGLNIACWLQRGAAAHPDRHAVIQGERVITYARFADEVARLAASLRGMGLYPGDRVAILGRNGPELLKAMLASFHGGFCAVPINARATPTEATEILRDADVSAIVHGPEYSEHVAALDGDRPRVVVALDYLGAAIATAEAIPVAEVGPAHPAWLFYTSGTTGKPKGATLTHRTLGNMTLAYLADVRRPGDTVLHAAPLTHGSGLYALPALATGATQVLTTSRSYDPEEILRTVSDYGVTDIAFLTPTMVKWLTEAASAPLPSLEHVVYGGGPMYRSDLEAAMDAFGRVFSQIYGQAEAPVTISRLTSAEHRDGGELLVSAGRAYTNADIAVERDDGSIEPDGEGEILTRGDTLMSGYWRNPEATETVMRAGWLHTGDVGRVDSDGLIYLLDRSKDVIISGGANVYPREVEDVILEHPLVRQVAVLGAPDETWGERVVSVMVLHDGADLSRVEPEVEQMCRGRLADYKLPRQFDLREELPTSPYGKVLKRQLRESYWRGRERRI